MPFFMRESVVSLIEKRIEALDKGYRQNLALVGLPGLGKTSFLSRVYQNLCIQPRYLPIYIALDAPGPEELVDRWCGAVLTSVFVNRGLTPPQNFHALLLEADPLVSKTTHRIRHLKKMLRKEKPSQLMKELFSLTETLSEETGKKLILILDDIEMLERFFVTDPFGVLGREIMIQKNTFFLASSSSPSLAEKIFREKLSMLFGNFEVLPFLPLGFRETCEVMDRSFPEVPFTYFQQQFLIRLTNGIPVYLEMILDQLKMLRDQEKFYSFTLNFEAARSIQDPQLLQALHREITDPKGRIYHIFNQKVMGACSLGKDGTGFFRALMAISRGRHKLSAIATVMERKSAEVKKILQRLTEQDFIVRQGQYFLIDDPLFSFWLREIFERRNHFYAPSETRFSQDAYDVLKREFERVCREQEVPIAHRLETLFRDFRHDVIEIEGRRVFCPHFSEVAVRPHGTGFTIIARNPKARWHCQAGMDRIIEEDVLSLMEDLKKYRKKPQQKILIALQGIDQNAKLLAQQAGIQIWDLRLVNSLLALYDLSKIVPLNPKEDYEPAMGSVAQGLHSA